ncbi:ornithine decarboxylase-like [Pieris napi]|uniref:ornithine decarboxylase-like n=1 Tax=Pieris napi TaxID=78633 RepID=UPI001FBBBBFC|nr:ornithine decarboxylase-like [Pieris napi]
MESRNTSKTYVLDKHTLEDIAETIIESGFQKDAFFIQDLDEIRRRIEYFNQMLPRVAIFYAIKSNDNEAILKLAASLGLGFDCATPGEIYKVLKLGVHPKSIIFASPIKMPEWMAYAEKSGITHTVFDSSFELKRIKQNWPDARTLIRIRVDSESVYQLGEKFGCDFETEAIPLLNEAAELKIKTKIIEDSSKMCRVKLNLA